MVGGAAISNLILKAAIQHNWAALPRLAPGPNTVEVRSQDATSAGAVTFELAWEEGDGVRKLRPCVTSNRDQYRVELESNSPPRLRHVLFAREDSHCCMKAMYDGLPRPSVKATSFETRTFPDFTEGEVSRRCQYGHIASVIDGLGRPSYIRNAQRLGILTGLPLTDRDCEWKHLAPTLGASCDQKTPQEHLSVRVYVPRHSPPPHARDFVSMRRSPPSPNPTKRHQIHRCTSPNTHRKLMFPASVVMRCGQANRALCRR
jgi:hypothetical protein